ncbi:MAG: type II toxin-antitoxin system VapC family toxin [Gemmatimonas sp.]
MLDTHVWVWLLSGDAGNMATAIPARIDRACGDGRCYVSDISAWEVATKSARQTLSMTMDPGAWLAEAAGAPGLSGVAVSRDILIASARLPMEQLPDLVDRILVATALRHGLAIVTADEHLLAFRKTWPLFSVIDARA